MPTSLIVVDDFLAPHDAQQLRQAALRLTCPDLQGALVGRNSMERLEIDGLSEAASRIVGEPIKAVSPTQ